MDQSIDRSRTVVACLGTVGLHDEHERAPRAVLAEEGTVEEVIRAACKRSSSDLSDQSIDQSIDSNHQPPLLGAAVVVGAGLTSLLLSVGQP